MSHKFTKTVVFVLAVLLAVVPFALAQGTTGQSSDRPSGAQQPGMRPTPGASSQSSVSGMPHVISATVKDVDQKDSTVKLQMQDGETVELKVPQTLVSDLNEGDSVQVTIRKTNDQKPGMGGSTSPSSPGSPTQPRPGQPRQ